MTNIQLYLAIGVPMLFNGLLILLAFYSLNSRMTGLEARMTNLENTVTMRFDLLMGRMSELEREIGRR